MKRRLVTVSALLLCACATDGQLPSEASSVQQELVVDTTETVPAHSVSPAVESFGKTARVDVVAQVDWASVQGHDRVDVARLAPAVAVAVSGAPVPVLIPSGESFVESAAVYTGADWVSTQHRGEGVSVEVFGTRRAFAHPEVAVHELERIAEERPLITRSEGVPFISFTRFGVAYQMSVECEAGPDDPKCAEFDYLRQVYDSLAIVGGAQ